MEDAIAQDPERYLRETGLKLIARQYTIGSSRFDLLFEDRHGVRLIVELQRGTLDREHTYKIFDYFDEYKSRNPREFVDLMVVANQIPAERRQRLIDKGIAFREIPVSEFPLPEKNLVPETIQLATISPVAMKNHGPSTDHTQFWNGLRNETNKQTPLFAGSDLPVEGKTSWGRSIDGVRLAFVVLKNEAEVQLCIQKSTEESEAMMRDFEIDKAEIQHGFGEELLRWERPNGKKRRKIRSQLIPLGRDDKEKWGELYTTLVDQMHRLANALSGRGPLRKNLWSQGTERLQ